MTKHECYQSAEQHRKTGRRYKRAAAQLTDLAQREIVLKLVRREFRSARELERLAEQSAHDYSDVDAAIT